VTTLPAPSDPILTQLRTRILGFAASRVSRDMAEDIVQDTLLLLSTKYAHLSSLSDLVPLSMRIVRLKLMNHWRKAKRAPVLSVDGPNPPPEPKAAEDVEDQVQKRMMLDGLLRGIDKLSERCRQLMKLRLEGREFEEIRQLMSVDSINTVYTWDNRCRKSLRETLGWFNG
jgi:RNA polymerase sigma-70 factor, ECF subfamily